MKQIFPKDIVDTTVEVHQFKHSNKSKIIYCILLVGVISSLIALPFINVAIYNTSQGLIKPKKERITLQASTNSVVFYRKPLLKKL